MLLFELPGGGGGRGGGGGGGGGAGGGGGYVEVEILRSFVVLLLFRLSLSLSLSLSLPLAPSLPSQTTHTRAYASRQLATRMQALGPRLSLLLHRLSSVGTLHVFLHDVHPQRVFDDLISLLLDLYELFLCRTTSGRLSVGPDRDA